MRDVKLFARCLSRCLFTRENALLQRKRNISTTIACLKDEKEKRKVGEMKQMPPAQTDQSPGWFSRLLGIQTIEPMKASHSSMLADKETVYELVTHTVRPGAMDDYLRLYGDTVKVLQSKCPSTEICGSWTVVIGKNQDQAVHLWKYKEGYAGADKTISILQSDQEVRKALAEQSKLLTKRRNTFVLPFSFWREPAPRPPKHVYELRSYVLKPGTMIEWGNNWARGINYRRDRNQDVCGFFSQIGQLYMVFHIWAYDNLNSRKQIREETWRKPGWDTNVAYTVPLIKEMDAKIMLPTSFSSLQ